MKSMFDNFKSLFEGLGDFASKSLNDIVVQGSDHNSVVNINGKVTVNGVEDAEKLELNGTVIDLRNFKTKIAIHVNGNVAGDLKTITSSVHVSGNANAISTTSGDIEIWQSVNGDVKTTSGDVQVSGNISGDVTTVSGDVKAKSISGAKINTVSGDINIGSMNGNINL